MVFNLKNYFLYINTFVYLLEREKGRERGRGRGGGENIFYLMVLSPDIASRAGLDQNPKAHNPGVPYGF